MPVTGGNEPGDLQVESDDFDENDISKILEDQPATSSTGNEEITVTLSFGEPKDGVSGIVTVDDTITKYQVKYIVDGEVEPSEQVMVICTLYYLSFVDIQKQENWPKSYYRCNHY